MLCTLFLVCRRNWNLIILTHFQLLSYLHNNFKIYNSLEKVYKLYRSEICTRAFWKQFGPILLAKRSGWKSCYVIFFIRLLNKYLSYLSKLKNIFVLKPYIYVHIWIFICTNIIYKICTNRWFNVTNLGDVFCKILLIVILYYRRFALKITQTAF